MTFYVRVFLAIIFKLVLEILNDRIIDNDFVHGVKLKSIKYLNLRGHL